MKLRSHTNAPIFKWNKRQMKCWPWAPTQQPWTGFCWSINNKARGGKKESVRKEFRNFGELQQLAASPGVHKRFTAHTHWPAWGQRDAWPWYTGAEALRVETPSSRQWCPLSVSFLKADYRSRGPGKKWRYHPFLSGCSPFLVSQSPRTKTGDAPREAANVAHKSNAA